MLLFKRLGRRDGVLEMLLFNRLGLRTAATGFAGISTDAALPLYLAASVLSRVFLWNIFGETPLLSDYEDSASIAASHNFK